MISEYVATRKMKRYERECRGISSGLIELMNIPGLGPKTLALLHKRVRISNFEDLKRALDTGALLKLKGFGQKKIDNIKRGIDLWLARQKRMLIGVALPLAENLRKEIRKIGLIERAEVAGSLRRRKEDIGDLDVLIISRDSPRAVRELIRLPLVKQVLELGDTKATVMIEGGIHVDIRAVARESYGAALQYFTGSKQHNIHLRKLARDRALKFNEYGVFRGDKRLGGRDEAEVYGFMPKLIEIGDLDILAHPSSRLLGTREPLEMDFERVLDAASKVGCALEINGSMYRLDLNDVLARTAQEAGALLAINSDAHSTAQLDQIRYGVFQACRGWVQARSVVNTWSWAKLNRWLKARPRRSNANHWTGRRTYDRVGVVAQVSGNSGATVPPDD